MGSSAKPPPPPKAAGPIRSSAAEDARAQDELRRQAKDRKGLGWSSSFNGTLIGPSSGLPSGMKSTLG